jgi:hypothetical protein
MTSRPLVITSPSGLIALANTSSSQIRCYDSNSSSLKFTLRIPKAETSQEVYELQKLVFATDQFLCALTPNNAVIVWDTIRGVASQIILMDSKDTLVDVAASSQGTKLYALAYHAHGEKYKVRVLQYECSSGKLEKKIKVGSSKSNVLGLALGNIARDNLDVMGVRLGESLRVFDLNGDKLEKVELTSSQAVIKYSADGSYLLASGEDSVVLFRLVREKKTRLHPMAVLKTGGVSSSVLIDNLDLSVSSTSIHVSLFQYGVGVSYFSIPSDTKSVKLDGMTPTLATATITTKIESALLSSSFHPTRNEIRFVFKHPSNAPGSGTILPIENMSLDRLNGSITLTPSSDEKDKNKKRKAGGAMAPGETGMEASMMQDFTSKKKKGDIEAEDEDGNNVAVAAAEEEAEFELHEDGEVGTSIAERLAMLSSAMEQTTDEEDVEEEEANSAETKQAAKSKFSAKNATTESLATLLTQALSSNDSIQLNIALQVTDPRLVENTVKSLQVLDAQRPDPNNTEGYIPMLMGHIVRRMASRHTLVTSLMSWIKAILLASSQISSKRMMQGASDEDEERMAREGRELAAKLGPLRNFLNERVECFPQLLRLEGRLALLGQQL